MSQSPDCSVATPYNLLQGKGLLVYPGRQNPVTLVHQRTQRGLLGARRFYRA